MKLAKLVATTVATATALGLASCNFGGAKTEPLSWTAAEKGIMSSMGYVFPEIFNKGEAEFGYEAPEEGYIQMLSYQITFDVSKKGLEAKTLAKLTELLGEDSLTEYEDGTLEYEVELLQDELYAYVSYEMDSGVLEVMPLAFGWNGVKEMLSYGLSYYKASYTAEEFFGDMPAFPCEGLTIGFMSSYSFGSRVTMNDYYYAPYFMGAEPADLDNYKAALAESSFHIYGWKLSSGVVNSEYYTSKEAKAGFVLTEGDGYVLMHVMDFDGEKYHTGADICHGEEVVTPIYTVETATYDLLTPFFRNVSESVTYDADQDAYVASGFWSKELLGATEVEFIEAIVSYMPGAIAVQAAGEMTLPESGIKAGFGVYGKVYNAEKPEEFVLLVQMLVVEGANVDPEDPEAGDYWYCQFAVFEYVVEEVEE